MKTRQKRGHATRFLCHLSVWPSNQEQVEPQPRPSAYSQTDLRRVTFPSGAPTVITMDAPFDDKHYFGTVTFGEPKDINIMSLPIPFDHVYDPDCKSQLKSSAKRC